VVVVPQGQSHAETDLLRSSHFEHSVLFFVGSIYFLLMEKWIFI
jgi:hypothetical protein